MMPVVVIIAVVPAISHICHNYCLVSIYKLHNQRPPPGRSVATSSGQQGNVVIYQRRGVSFNGRKMQICLTSRHTGARDTNYGGSVAHLTPAT